jgi:hypothetical protein
MLLTDIKKFYHGKPLEEGGTAISSGVSPPIKFLFMQRDVTDDYTVIDYGAGKDGRNAKWLRDRGIKVYAYDPHHGTDVDGWEGVSNTPPRDKAGVLFTNYVLNVVPESMETDILKATDALADHVYHITRNMDIVNSVTDALNRGDKTVTDFYENEYGGGPLSADNIMNFCFHGVKTSRGFQRIPKLEHKGYNLVKTTQGYKIYTK